MKRQIQIGELAKITDCRVETIRFYEKEGILPQPPRNAGNYRQYSEVHVERLLFIRHCRSIDINLNDIKRLLQIRDTPQDDCSEVSLLLDNHIGLIDVRLAELERLRNQLIFLSERCSGTNTADKCEILKELGSEEFPSN